MSQIKTGGAAFPFPSDADSGEPGELGMTLRDYFAAKALQGLLAAGGGVVTPADQRAAQAYKMADAMLRARDAT